MAITAVGDTLSVGSGASSDVQPPSGETWDITAWAGGELTSTRIGIKDLGEASNMQTAAAFQPSNLKLVITNSQYAFLRNDSAGTVNMGYRGVKL